MKGVQVVVVGLLVLVGFVGFLTVLNGGGKSSNTAIASTIVPIPNVYFDAVWWNSNRHTSSAYIDAFAAVYIYSQQ